VVVSIRGTLSMKDVMTDLNAEGEVLPLSPPRDDWLGHKGMVQAAEYIRKKLYEEGIITKALEKVCFSKFSFSLFRSLMNFF
jgi:sn1-specific diacylglycerol lipase